MRVLFALAVAACADDTMIDPDGGIDPDGAVVDGDATTCTTPSLDAPWLGQLLSDSITQLASAPRFTTTQRATARAYLKAQLAEMGWTATEHTFSGGANVVATIPATMGSGNEIILGAHFDTVMSSPGANDNASGTAVVLAVARYLKDMPCRTAPVTVVLFYLEETGLFGSRAFAMTKQPATTRAVHTIDQVSWDSDNDRSFELEVPTPTLEAEWRAAASRVGVPVVTTNSQGTDHESFRDAGFAAVGLTEEYVGGDTSPNRHLSTDTPSTVNMPYLVLAAKLTAQVILTEVAP
jgi:Zn-dependent M28 family amino/carboxypeptidase